MPAKEQKPLIILDRDGVINSDSENYIRSPEDWNALPGSVEAIAQLSQAGFRVVVATNQSGLSRGYFDMTTLLAIHKKMHTVVEEANGQIDAVFFCPHTDSQQCECRKPKPGMLVDICSRFDVLPEQTIMVGDSRRDISAAVAIGCQPVLVLTGNGKKTLEKNGLPETMPVFENLLAFSDHMVSQCNL